MKSLKFKVFAAVLITAVLLLIVLRMTARPILEEVSFSSVFYDKDGRLLRVTLADDGIYRIRTPVAKISEKIINATLLYEDRWFYFHLGVNPVSLTKAVMSVFKKSPRPLGASTITMQLARIKYDINSKTVSGKFQQILAALWLEMRYSKKDILEAYFNLAPYGHNIEGIGGASLIYFGVKPEKLSSIEALSLCVIPQNPTGRTPTNALGMAKILEARKRLWGDWLKKYPHDKNYEPLLNMQLLVDKVTDLPNRAPHFVNSLILKGVRGNTDTTLDLDYQNLAERSLQTLIDRNSYLGLKNGAVLLINHKTMEILAYVGSGNFFDSSIRGQVDGVSSRRSPGSTMKPFIFGLGIEQGIIHPKSMMKDAPKRFGAYSPENSDRGFMGPLFAVDALVNSRNIPAIDLLNRLEKGTFYNLLKTSGIKRLKKEDFYGSALALGGFEMTMLDLGLFYAGLARFGETQCINFLPNGETCYGKSFRLFSEEAASLTLDMMAFNPKLDGYDGLGRVSWKTGTSFGYRDAWSAGIFGDYVLVTWVGNFDSSGNPLFKGRGVAASLFFSIISGIKNMSSDVFDEPFPPRILKIMEVDICTPTGDLANKFCPQTEKGKFIPGVSPLKLSDIFREIPIDKYTGLRSCVYEPDRTVMKVYEFWSSDIYDLFLKSGIRKNVPPPYTPGCSIEDMPYGGLPPLIYSPTKNVSYFISKYDIGVKEIGFVASAGAEVKKLFWFLNGSLIGEGQPNNPVFWKAIPGNHSLSVSDEQGRAASIKFSVQLN